MWRELPRYVPGNYIHEFPANSPEIAANLDPQGERWWYVNKWMQFGVEPRSYSLRQQIARDFHSQIRGLVEQAGVHMRDSSWRAKTDKSIDSRLERRFLDQRDRPLYDLYGVRLILSSEDIQTVKNLLLTSFPEEYRFPVVFPRVRFDSSDPNTGRSDYGDPRYEGVHVAVPFGEDLPLPHIGEVQLLTRRQLRIAHKTRRLFMHKRKNYINVHNKIWDEIEAKLAKQGEQD